MDCHLKSLGCYVHGQGHSTVSIFKKWFSSIFRTAEHFASKFGFVESVECCLNGNVRMRFWILETFDMRGNKPGCKCSGRTKLIQFTCLFACLFLISVSRVMLCSLFFFKDNATCSNGSESKLYGGPLPHCPSSYGRYVVPILLGFHVMITHVLLLNLLIARFGCSLKYFLLANEMISFLSAFLHRRGSVCDRF